MFMPVLQGTDALRSVFPFAFFTFLIACSFCLQNDAAVHVPLQVFAWSFVLLLPR